MPKSAPPRPAVPRSRPPAKRAAWPIQDLKNNLSAALREAATTGHQFVTKHGEPIAVLMTVEDYRALQARQSIRDGADAFRREFGGVDLAIERDRSAASNHLREVDFGT